MKFCSIFLSTFVLFFCDKKWSSFVREKYEWKEDFYLYGFFSYCKRFFKDFFERVLWRFLSPIFDAQNRALFLFKKTSRILEVFQDINDAKVIESRIWERFQCWFLVNQLRWLERQRPHFLPYPSWHLIEHNLDYTYQYFHWFRGVARE